MKMTRYDMVTTENTSLTLCRLLGVWIHKIDLGPEEITDFEAIFHEAKKHLLSAAACAALEDTGLMEYCPPEIGERFRASRLASVRRTLLMDAEREKLISALEEKGIWYAPLKGIVIKDFYPLYGTRQFADNDILFDASRWRDVREYMVRKGYEAKNVGRGCHDSYIKQPIYSFEMHRMLFAGNGVSGFLRVFSDYYADVRERLIRDDGTRFGYHFDDKDFYIYFLAHAYKHCCVSGTGLRTLLDLYLYNRAKPEMDAGYIGGELQKLGLTEFERVCRSLSEKLFGSAFSLDFTEEEREMFDWIESSGTYGTQVHGVQSGLRSLQPDGEPFTARTKAKYLLRRVFPAWEWYKTAAPFVYSHAWALPFFCVFRLFRGLIVKGKKNFREAREVYATREK